MAPPAVTCGGLPAPVPPPDLVHAPVTIEDGTTGQHFVISQQHGGPSLLMEFPHLSENFPGIIGHPTFPVVLPGGSASGAVINQVSQEHQVCLRKAPGHRQGRLEARQVTVNVGNEQVTARSSSR